jgi:hypothetical protein
MNYTPYTRAQADEISEDFEDLLDTEFSLGGVSYLVDSIIVCPFAEPQRTQFLSSLPDGQQADMATDQYDVLLQVTDAATEQVTSYIAISDYVAEKGVAYNFPQV